MTVKQLIKLLMKEKNQNRIVVLSSDEEGNSFSELVVVETGAYDADNNEIGIEKLTPELEKTGFTPEDVMSGRGQPALILYPSP